MSTYVGINGISRGITTGGGVSYMFKNIEELEKSSIFSFNGTVSTSNRYGYNITLYPDGNNSMYIGNNSWISTISLVVKHSSVTYHGHSVKHIRAVNLDTVHPDRAFNYTVKNSAETLGDGSSYTRVTTSSFDGGSISYVDIYSDYMNRIPWTDAYFMHFINSEKSIRVNNFKASMSTVSSNYYTGGGLDNTMSNISATVTVKYIHFTL